MKSTCWDTRATDSIIKSGQKDTEASVQSFLVYVQTNSETFLGHSVESTKIWVETIQSKQTCQNRE